MKIKWGKRMVTMMTSWSKRLHSCMYYSTHDMYSWTAAERLVFGGPDLNSRIKFEPRTHTLNNSRPVLEMAELIHYMQFTKNSELHAETFLTSNVIIKKNFCACTIYHLHMQCFTFFLYFSKFSF